MPVGAASGRASSAFVREGIRDGLKSIALLMRGTSHRDRRIALGIRLQVGLQSHAGILKYF